MFRTSLTALLVLVSLSACKQSPAAPKTVPAQAVAAAAASAQADAAETMPAAPLRVGASPVPHAELIRAVIPELAARGVHIELKTYEDYGAANVAVANRELDADFFQTEPFLWRWRTLHPSPLVSVGRIHVEPMAVYSKKLAGKGLAAVKQKSLVLLPDDLANQGRALLLLDHAGLIEIDRARGFDATLADVVKNPHQLVFRLEAPARLPQLADAADLLVLNGNTALEARLDLGMALYREDGSTPFANVVVALEERAHDPRLVELVRALRGPTARALLEGRFKGAAIPVSEPAQAAVTP